MAALRSLLLLLLLLPPPWWPGPGGEARAGRTCTETRQVLGARGYSLNLLPPALISGEHLRVCPQDYTCCSSETELRLSRDTEEAFRVLLEESGSFLLTTLAARQRKLDGEDPGLRASLPSPPPPPALLSSGTVIITTRAVSAKRLQGAKPRSKRWGRYVIRTFP
uniref:Glypican 2 n=1 Tax=Ornithorhynchus anatinus TaxID=9258 RepID=A0A6I8N1A4_ORNAN